MALKYLQHFFFLSVADDAIGSGIIGFVSGFTSADAPPLPDAPAPDAAAAAADAGDIGSSLISALILMAGCSPSTSIGSAFISAAAPADDDD